MDLVSYVITGAVIFAVASSLHITSIITMFSVLPGKNRQYLLKHSDNSGERQVESHSVKTSLQTLSILE
jgi:hypothetical protein